MQPTGSPKSDSSVARHHERVTGQYTTHTCRDRQVHTGPAPATGGFRAEYLPVLQRGRLQRPLVLGDLVVEKVHLQRQLSVPSHRFWSRGNPSPDAGRTVHLQAAEKQNQREAALNPRLLLVPQRSEFILEHWLPVFVEQTHLL